MLYAFPVWVMAEADDVKTAEVLVTEAMEKSGASFYIVAEGWRGVEYETWEGNYGANGSA